MADAVSKLYAEIGFKLNQEGLKKAKEEIKKLSDQLSAINSVAKKQAETHGIYSKERTQKDIMRERIFRRMIKKKKNNLLWLHRQEDKIESDAQKKSEQRRRAEEKAADERIKTMRRSYHLMARVARNGMKLLATTGKGLWDNTISPALTRSIATRDFMMYTGMGLGTLQKIQERFASVGSSMSRQDIMGELSSVMDNLTKIRFGQGSPIGQKLLGISAAAQNRDFNKVLSIIEKASVGVDNQAFVETLNQMGFSGQRWLPYFRARQRVSASMPELDDEGQKALENAKTAIVQFKLAIERSADLLTAKFSPYIEEATDSLTKFLVEFIKKIDWKTVASAIGNTVTRMVEIFVKLGRIIDKIASWLHIDTSDLSVNKNQPTAIQYLQKHAPAGMNISLVDNSVQTNTFNGITDEDSMETAIEKTGRVAQNSSIKGALLGYLGSDVYAAKGFSFSHSGS